MLQTKQQFSMPGKWIWTPSYCCRRVKARNFRWDHCIFMLRFADYTMSPTYNNIYTTVWHLYRTIQSNVLISFWVYIHTGQAEKLAWTRLRCHSK
jgi:hypothetical protein